MENTKPQSPYNMIDNDQQTPNAVIQKQNNTPSQVENDKTVQEPARTDQSNTTQNKNNIIDTIIKVAIDIIARLTGQPSPTGGKHPTTHNFSVPNILSKVWDKMENFANQAVQKTQQSVQKTLDTVNKPTTKEQTTTPVQQTTTPVQENTATKEAEQQQN
jgi:hypothetical protein